MKKQLVLAFAFLCLFISCNEDGTPLAAFLNTDQLASSFYDINIDRDTVLHTKQGAEITILKGSVSAGTKKIVRLEIKEAYTISDIVKAGLQTKNGDRLLSSGGMIYLQIKDEDAKIVKAIGVSIPSDNTEPGMQLFKGVESKDGNIDWTDPLPLQPNQTIDSIKEGEAIFQANCVSCHNPLKDATGPSLAFTPQRRDRVWMKAFIHSSAQLIASGDPLANCLYEQWNKTAMTSFPNLTDDELEKLYRYLNQQSKNLNPADYPDFKASFDSCAVYEKARRELLAKRGDLINDNGPEVARVMLDTGYHILVAPNNLVVPRNDYSTYYTFSITSLGWFNVDVFAETVPGFEASTLKASLKGTFRDFTNIYIVIPDAKICVEGGLLKDEESAYGFYTDDGKLPLPQGKEAYILAFREEGDHIIFGLTHFITSHENNVGVTMSIVTKEEMNSKIQELNFKDLSIKSSDTKNADTIRKLDVNLKNIELLKPKGSDCHCLPVYESDSMTYIQER